MKHEYAKTLTVFAAAVFGALHMVFIMYVSTLEGEGRLILLYLIDLPLAVVSDILWRQNEHLAFYAFCGTIMYMGVGALFGLVLSFMRDWLEKINTDPDRR